MNKEKPLQLNFLQSAKAVAKQITPLLNVGIKKVVYLKDFEQCQGLGGCMVLGGKQKALSTNMEEFYKEHLKTYRGLPVVSIDTGLYKIKLDEEFVAKR